MKQVTRIFGILSGIGAIVWLVRDRLISLTTPREPEPPQFRTVASARSDHAAGDGETMDAAVGDDLKLVKGIGPVYERGLHAAGVMTFADLAAADPSSLADTLGVSESHIDDWQAQATGLIRS